MSSATRDSSAMSSTSESENLGSKGRKTRKVPSKIGMVPERPRLSTYTAQRGTGERTKTSPGDKWRGAYAKVLFSLKVMNMMGFQGDPNEISPLVQLSKQRNLRARESQVGLGSVLDDKPAPILALGVNRAGYFERFEDPSGRPNDVETDAEAASAPLKPGGGGSMGAPGGALAALQEALNKRGDRGGPRRGTGSQVGFQFDILRDSLLRTQAIDILTKKAPKERKTKDLEVLLELVKGDSFFKNLVPAVRLELCRVMRFVTYDANMVVFRQGDEGRFFYVIFRGRVGILVQRNGVSVQANELTAGQSFGELALANDELRTATIETREYCELLVIAKEDYRSILNRLQARDINEKVSCFAKLPYFSSWDRVSLMGLVKSCKQVCVPANFVVCKQGAPVSHLYIIKKGACRLLKEVPCPDVADLKPGESETADRCRVLATCFVEVEQLDRGGFFGESGLTAAGPGRRRRSLSGGPLAEAGGAGEGHSGSVYEASMVSDRACEILAVRLQDFLRFSDRRRLDDLLRFSEMRKKAFSEAVVRDKLLNQILWEREKHDLLADMALPRFSRAVAAYREGGRAVPRRPTRPKPARLGDASAPPRGAAVA